MISRRVGFTVTLLTGIAICVGTLTSSLTPLTSFGADTLHHGIAYAAFALPLVLVHRKYWRLMLTVTLILASTIELIQSLVNRSGEPLDLLTNATGGLIGLVPGTILSWLHQKMYPRPISLYACAFNQGSERIFRKRRGRRL